jgi:uncharacterized protein (TIGR02996 family)
MTPEVGFLRAMQEDEDDTSRLIFADWLDEHGQPERAEFIRIQCELARWVPDLHRRTQLQQREQDLLARHGDAWIGPLAEHCLSWRFERGLAQVTMEIRRFVSRKTFALRARKMFSDALVESLRLEGPNNLLVSLRSAAHLEEATRLDLSQNRLEDNALVGLCEKCPALHRLCSIDLSGNSLSWVVLPDLMRAAPRLRWIEFRNNAVRYPPRNKALSRRTDFHGNALDPSASDSLRRCQDGLIWQQPGRPPRLFNSIGMQFALIPAGTFLMGAPAGETGHFPNETPRHEVTLTRPFYLGLYPVTQHDYETVLGTNPSHFRSGNGGRPNHPVEDVTWEDAVRFCEELSAQPEERAAGRVYRLPTEAEWEHACRAGTTTPFSWGSSAWSAQANFSGQHPYGGAPTGPYLGRTSPVGSYPPNAFGLYDLHGNVWEWCNDWYDKDYYEKSPCEDPPGSRKGNTHVLRGGSWYIVGRGIRCAERCYTSEAPVTHAGTIGFRVAMTLRG